MKLSKGEAILLWTIGICVSVVLVSVTLLIVKWTLVALLQ